MLRLDIDACDAVLVLPDLLSRHLLMFVESLLSPLKSASNSQRKALRSVLQTLGTGFEDNLEDHCVITDHDVPEDVRGVMREMKREPQENKEEGKSLSNLAVANLDHLTDTVLRENFSDQEGRLVCLVCYQILPAGDFPGFREHVAKHEVCIIYENI